MRTSAPGKQLARGSHGGRVAALAAVAALAVAAGCGTADEESAPPDDGLAAETAEEGSGATESEAGQETGAPAGDDDARSGEGGAADDSGEADPAGEDDGAGGDGSSGEEAGEDLEDFVDPGSREESEPSGADLVVTDVRTGVHGHYERVVLDLEGDSQVGWWAEYSDNPALDGSGAPVSLAGDATLAVIVRGVAQPSGEDHPYDPGQLLVEPEDTQMVTEVLRTAPFEGQLQVFVGTREEVSFRVFRLGEPERLVIDVLTH